MKYSIITIHHIHNFGSVLQAYSLYMFMKMHGYDVEVIDYRPNYFNSGRNWIRSYIGKVLNYRSYNKRKQKFEQFIKEQMKLSPCLFKTIDDLRMYYLGKDIFFIAGGDQLWNDYHPCGRDEVYKLAFIRNATKIAYGTSMGRDNYSSEELKQIASQVSDFSTIMLRERSTVDMFEKFTDVPLRHVIDPVGLLNISYFKDLAIEPAISEPYAVMYLANSGELLDEAVRILSQRMNLKIVHISGFKKKCFCDIFLKDVGPKEILGYILHADYILSASFHATLFAILFNIQFATILPGENTNARIVDLLRLTNLEKRIINSREQLSIIEKKVDFNIANDFISNFGTESRNMLLSTLEVFMRKD